MPKLKGHKTTILWGGTSLSWPSVIETLLGASRYPNIQVLKFEMIVRPTSSSTFPRGSYKSCGCCTVQLGTHLAQFVSMTLPSASFFLLGNPLYAMQPLAKKMRRLCRSLRQKFDDERSSSLLFALWQVWLLFIEVECYHEMYTIVQFIRSLFQFRKMILAY